MESHLSGKIKYCFEEKYNDIHNIIYPDFGRYIVISSSESKMERNTYLSFMNI